MGLGWQCEVVVAQTCIDHGGTACSWAERRRDSAPGWLGGAGRPGVVASWWRRADKGSRRRCRAVGSGLEVSVSSAWWVPTICGAEPGSSEVMAGHQCQLLTVTPLQTPGTPGDSRKGPELAARGHPGLGVRRGGRAAAQGVRRG